MLGGKRNYSSMGRRRFMGAIGALGAPTAVKNLISQNQFEQLVEDPDKEVPIIERHQHTNPAEIRKGAAPEREAIYGKISRDRWERVEAAHDAADSIRGALNSISRSPLLEIEVTTLHSRSGGYEKAIQVNWTRLHEEVFDQDRNEVRKSVNSPSISKDRLETLLPSAIKGTARDDQNKEWRTEKLPVIVQEVNRAPQSCKRYYYTDDYTDIPGGAKIDCSGEQLQAPKGTICTPAYDNDSDTRRMLTAGHNLEPNGDDNQNIYQPGNSDFDVDGKQVNSKTRFDGLHKDHGLVKAPNQTGEDKYAYRLASDDGGYKQDMYIDGITSWMTLKYHEGDQDYTIHRQGARTGTHTGYITGILTDGKRIKTSMVSASGDSGGPYYRVSENFDGTKSVSIAGMHNYGDPDSTCSDLKSGASGHSITFLEEELNLTV